VPKHLLTQFALKKESGRYFICRFASWSESISSENYLTL